MLRAGEVKVKIPNPGTRTALYWRSCFEMYMPTVSKDQSITEGLPYLADVLYV